MGAKKILEIGVAYGYHADFLCTVLPSIQYVGVDPHQASYDENDIFVGMYKNSLVKYQHKQPWTDSLIRFLQTL